MKPRSLQPKEGTLKTKTEGESGREPRGARRTAAISTLGKATGIASQVACVPACFCDRRGMNSSPKRNQELWLQATWWADSFPWPDARQKGEGQSLKRRKPEF